MLAESVLRKHVAIIHAYSVMSTLQRKIFNILLHKAISFHKNSQNESIAIECEMPISELIGAVKFNSNNTQYLKESIDSLASLKIEWNLLKDRVPSSVSFLNLRILHGSPTFYQNGTFNFSFHKFILNFVGSPDIYGTIDINLQSEFESKYGHALYENSTRFLNMQKGKIIQLDTFRKLLGVSDEKYSVMRELNRNVIKPAVEEVNDRSEFTVDLQPIKIGKKVKCFEISVNPKQKSPLKNDTKLCDDDHKILGEMDKYFGKISDSTLNNLLRNYSHEYIYEKIAYTKQYTKKDNSGFYPVAYFISAIKNDYKSDVQLTTDNTEQNDKPKCKSDWQDKLESLRSDLAKWRSNLQAANNNQNLVEKINKIVVQCKKSLDEHMLQKPDHINAKEAE